MSFIRKIFNRSPKVVSPWETKLYFQNPDLIESRKRPLPKTYMGSQLVITLQAENEVRIGHTSIYAAHITHAGAFGRVTGSLPICHTEPTFFHETPISKVAALTWLDHHFSDNNFATEGQRAAYNNWKAALPEHELQGYKLTPRPADPAIS